MLRTKTVTVDGQKVEVVDGRDGITPGVSYNASFYGGSGDDYFEVNHNVGALALLGESGDDLFFLKAQLQDASGGGTEEMAGGQIVAGAGAADGTVDENDQDALIDYVRNNRVEILGGSGFDTVAVAGTALADTFYTFTDNDGRQYLFGAGLALENIDGIERLALMTGAGDDTVYLYGLKETLSLLINLGSGDDSVIVGGEEQTFDVVYPAASAVYTVEHGVFKDVFQSESIDYNDIVFTRREMSLPEKQEAFKQFYTKWVKSKDVSMSNEHWELLESNLALALELFCQGVDKAANNPVYGTTIRKSPDNWNSGWWQRHGRSARTTSATSMRWKARCSVSRDRSGGSPMTTGTTRSRFWDGGEHPILPDTVSFETLMGVAPRGLLRRIPHSRLRRSTTSTSRRGRVHDLGRFYPLPTRFVSALGWATRVLTIGIRS